MKTKFPKRLLIRITAAHIRDGVKRDCENCPIALAVLDKIGHDKIDSDTLNVRTSVIFQSNFKPFNIIRYKMSNTLLDFIYRFDCGQPVGPTKGYITLFR